MTTTTEGATTMVERINHTFTANCVTDVPKDDVLAIALSPFAAEYEISTASARRFGPVVSVRITFRTYDQENVVRLASLAASTLLHQWPTDTVRIDGREPKYHGRQDSLLKAAKDSGHLIITKVD